MRTFLILLVLAIAGLVVTSYWVSRPLFDEPLAVTSGDFEILPTGTALTLAMTRQGRVLLVLGGNPETVRAVDINDTLNTSFADTVSAYQQAGYAQLAVLQSAEYETFAISELGVPLQPVYPHIAAGTNYRAHADELGLEGEPFLFPKRTEATTWDAAVPLRTRLDYEAELCAVPLAVHTTAAPAPLGFVLCNDFTDRWDLLRHIDTDQPMGRTGFSFAKGGPGMLPVGPFLVVPLQAADVQGFYADIQLQLAVNGRLRQRAEAGLMIWSPHEILNRALADCAVAYPHGDETLRLTDCGGVQAGTLILTGTPAGVIFRLANIWAPYAYLGTGDEVLVTAAHLGLLRNQIGG
ncbi:MAG: fumarylacetoacetate hydrolase family protein [Pseudomonadota bacterium]